MTEGEENIIIKGVLLEAISRDFSEELSNNKEVSVSPRFKRQMMAMMNNPNKWAERHKRDYRRRFVKVVATIVLTCSLPFGVLTVASPTVRAAVIDWVVEWYESSIIYKFFGESDSTKLPLYEVIDLPFDYTRIGIPQELPNNTEIIYENSDGEILRFEYMRVEEGFMKKRIIPLFFLVLLLATVMIPTSAAISTKAISGKPTLKIEGTTAYCVGKYNSGNRNDAISITVTLMQGSKEIASWSASGKGSVTISKTCKVETKKTYKLVLSATVNGVAKPDVSVTATAK